MFFIVQSIFVKFDEFKEQLTLQKENEDLH